MRAAALASDPVESREPAPAPRFTVRFSRNTFGWSGDGTLEIVPDGLRFSGRREGLLSYARARDSVHLPLGSVTSVLREGDVVRLQFRRSPSEGTELAEFSSGSSTAATTIVSHLPIALAVELDHPAPSVASSASRRAINLRSSLSGLLILVVMIGALATVVAVRDERIAAPAPIPASVPVPGEATPAEPAVEPPPMTVEDLAALRAELRDAHARTESMRARFSHEFRRLMDGRGSQSDFARTLEGVLIPGWGLEGTERARRAANAGTRARALELMALSAGSWSLGLSTYADGLRNDDPEMVRRAFEAMSDAEEFERQAYALLPDSEERASLR
jgi:hypothetical protein